MTFRAQLARHGLRTCPIFLRADPHPVQVAGARLQLAQERRVAFLAKVCGEALRVRLVGETAELHGPHSG